LTQYEYIIILVAIRRRSRRGVVVALRLLLVVVFAVFVTSTTTAARRGRGKETLETIVIHNDSAATAATAPKNRWRSMADDGRRGGWTY
jgi:hypothetical protein